MVYGLPTNLVLNIIVFEVAMYYRDGALGSGEYVVDATKQFCLKISFK